MPTRRHLKNRKRGFTLIELLLSIGIIAILAGIVIVAINPSRQFAQTRNAMRRSDTKQILAAIQQYKVENEGDLPSTIDSSLRMIGTDATGCNTLCSGSVGDPVSFSIRVSDSNDDAEEFKSDGEMYVDSTDLELVEESEDQLVGMRFRNVIMPPGSTITSATIEFTTDEGNTGPTNLIFYGEDIDDSPTFVEVNDYNISSRTRTTASVAWDNVPEWNTENETHKTPDLSAIVQEIIDRPAWFSGNNIVFIVDGDGERCAESYDGTPSEAPLLEITYQQIDGEMTLSSCIDLSASLVTTHLQSMPEDPSTGTSGNTNYAVKELEDGRLRVRSCGAELDEEIVLDQ